MQAVGNCRQNPVVSCVVGEMGAGSQVELGAFEQELPVRQGPYRAQRLVSTLLRGKLPGTNLQLGPFQRSSSWSIPHTC
jgi:hypothetical protein